MPRLTELKKPQWRVLRNSKREYANNWAILYFLKTAIIFPKGQIAFVAA
jgi:hypothetical protein